MMGDRTYVQITVRKDEAKSEAGQDLLGQWGFSLDGSCEESAEDWFAEELNYGGHGFFEDWGDAGLTCVGSQDGGSSYSPSDIVCWKGEHVEADTGRDGGYVIGFGDDFNPLAEDVARVGNFLRKWAAANKWIRATPVELLAQIDEDVEEEDGR